MNSIAPTHRDRLHALLSGMGISKEMRNDMVDRTMRIVSDTDMDRFITELSNELSTQ